MGMPTFDHALKTAEIMLEQLQRKVVPRERPLCGDATFDELRRDLYASEEWARQRAREGIERARAELAKIRDEIYWRDEDLPF
jgi:hypothetical protein